MNLQQYWTLHPQQKNEIFKQVIIQPAYCDHCGEECSEDGYTCFWCDAAMCLTHVVYKELAGQNITECLSCRQWEMDTGRRIEEGP